MGLPLEKPRYSLAEYFALANDSQDKLEYRDGRVLVMMGGTAGHSLITANVIRELGNRLKGKPCRAYDSNLRIGVPKTVLYSYPDVSVICGKLDYDSQDQTRQTITNPRLIVEVLSPSTEAYDRGEKFNNYRRIESLKEYVLAAQDGPEVQVFFRQDDGTWLFSAWSGLDAVVRLRSLEIDLPLAEVYAGVEFPAKADHLAAAPSPPPPPAAIPVT